MAPIDKRNVAVTIVLAVILRGESLTLPMAIGPELIVAGTEVLIHRCGPLEGDGPRPFNPR